MKVAWAGRVARIDDNRPPLLLYRNDPEGLWGRDRPKMRRINDVTQDQDTKSTELVAQSSGQTSVELDSLTGPSIGCSESKIVLYK